MQFMDGRENIHFLILFTWEAFSKKKTPPCLGLWFYFYQTNIPRKKRNHELRKKDFITTHILKSSWLVSWILLLGLNSQAESVPFDVINWSGGQGRSWLMAPLTAPAVCLHLILPNVDTINTPDLCTTCSTKHYTLKQKLESLWPKKLSHFD